MLISAGCGQVWFNFAGLNIFSLVWFGHFVEVWFNLSLERHKEKHHTEQLPLNYASIRLKNSLVRVRSRSYNMLHTENVP